MSWGSQQWRLFRRARRDGATIEEAALIGGQSPEEARLLDEIDQRNSPLPMEAFDLLYDPAARAAAATEKEDHMAEEEDQVDEVHAKDYEGVARTLKHDIVPANSAAASKQQEAGQGYKHIKKILKCRPDAARNGLRVHQMEDAMKEAFIEDFVGVFNELEGYPALTYKVNNLFSASDTLATLSDDDGDAFDEADEDELATQLSRPSTEAAKAADDAAKEEAEAKPKRTRRTARPKDTAPPPGTGASAVKAMNEASATVQ